jgi:hypothetical protein
MAALIFFLELRACSSSGETHLYSFSGAQKQREQSNPLASFSEQTQTCRWMGHFLFVLHS